MTSGRAWPYSQRAIKKGIAAAPLSGLPFPPAWNAANQLAALTDLAPVYWYNYRLDTEGADYPGFIPMFTTTTFTGSDIDTAVALAMGAIGYKWLAFLNEPDGVGTGITAAAAVTAYNVLVARPSVVAARASGLKILGPSMATPGPPWTYLTTFLAGVTLRPDALAMHGYGAGNVADVPGQVAHTNGVVNDYQTQYPNDELWLTEFATFDGAHTVPTDEQVSAYADSMCQWNEARSQITHYSYWILGPATRTQEANFPHNYLYDDAVVRTALGTAYKNNLYSQHSPIIT